MSFSFSPTGMKIRRRMSDPKFNDALDIKMQETFKKYQSLDKVNPEKASKLYNEDIINFIKKWDSENYKVIYTDILTLTEEAKKQLENKL